MWKSLLFSAVVLQCFPLAACSVAEPTPEQSSAAEVRDTAAPADSSTAPSPRANGSMPASLHWARNSAEYRASVKQSFALATMLVEEKVGYRTQSAGPWGVVLDADETILDNSQFQKESWEQNAGYTQERWTAWVHRREAKALPGAAAFLSRVRALGGKIAIVTNRNTVECPDTETNLKAEALVFDIVLCRSDSSDKNPRFKGVATGTAPSTLPALDVLAFVGDNIKDFPALDQSIATGPESSFAEFGSRFIVVPNPMYGSWETNLQN